MERTNPLTKGSSSFFFGDNNAIDKKSRCTFADRGLFYLSVPSSDLSKIVLLGQKEKTTMTKNAFNYTSFYEESKL